MKPAYFLFVGVSALLSCSLLGTRPPAAPARTVQPCKCPEPTAPPPVDCEAKAMAAIEPRVKVRTVQKPGPPLKCAGEGPKVMSVSTTQCADGMVCLDETAQRALALNLAAYEAWVQRVQACENKKE